MSNKKFNVWGVNFVNGFVKLIGIFLLLFAAFSIIHGFFALRVSFKEGRFGFELDYQQKDVMLITKVFKDFPAEQAGIKQGDRIMYLNGEPLTKENIDSLWGEAIAGTQMVITIQRGREMLEFNLTRKLLPLIDRVIRILFLLVLPTLMLAYILVGLWGIFKHPSFITNLIALVCFFFGGIICSINISLPYSPLLKIVDIYNVKHSVSVVSLHLAPLFWVILFIYFPQKLNFFKRKKNLTILSIVVIPFILILSRVIFPVSFKNSIILQLIEIAYIFIYIFIGVYILSKGAKREENILKKRQYQLILFGIKYGSASILLGFCCVMLYWYVMKNWLEYIGWITFLLFLVTQVVGLMLPFTFLNSFFHNKILETEKALKRKIRYLSATAVLFFIYLLVGFFLSHWIIVGFELTDTPLIVLIVLALSLTFSPLHSRMMHWLEEKLYPEKTKYKNALKELIRKMSGYIEESQILETLALWIRETMGITPIYALSIDRIQGMNIPLKINSPKSVLAKVKNGSSFFWDEVSEDSVDLIDEDERNWAHQKGICITVPMISGGEPVGVLSIGKKKNKEDFTGDDLEIFQEAAYYTAVVIQNIKLQAEHLEKKRIEKELEVARSIQNQLMPRKIPSVKGLEVHGENRPCFEVGGDYFDIIPLDESKTALIIADVSGKGAGAALLMSNLQASIRMAVSMMLPLEDILYKINNIICENSLPSQFITFFVTIWDNDSNTLKYINAGHNAPFIIRNNNRIKRLTPTGIGLGIKMDQTYKCKMISLSLNESIAIYTDGIEEFFNYQLEAFGYERMLKVFKEYKKFHPREIIQQLFLKLKEFSGGKEAYHCDDLTIIVAKRTN